MAHKSTTPRTSRTRGIPALPYSSTSTSTSSTSTSTWTLTNQSQAGRILHEWAQLPCSREEFLSKTIPLQQKYFPTTQPLPGVVSLLSTLRSTSSPHVHIALATSSHAANFKLKTGHLSEHFAVFDQEHRVLGDDPRIPKGRGKPAPDIYLLALETVNARIRREAAANGTQADEVRPEQCLVFEDSVPGVEAGRRAGMQVVWCPHPGLLNEYKGREELVLAGRAGMGEKEEEAKNVTLGKVDGHTGEKTKDVPGEVGDGWARLFGSLEDFPYADYGINV